MPKVQSDPPAGKVPKNAERRKRGRLRPMFTARLMRKMAANLGQAMVARWPAAAAPCPGAEALGLAWLQAKAIGQSFPEVLDQVAAHPRETARTLAECVEPKAEGEDQTEDRWHMGLGADRATAWRSDVAAISRDRNL